MIAGVPKRVKYRKVNEGRPIISKSTVGLGRMLYDPDTEVLTGRVQGIEASAPEERWARALSSLSTIQTFYFRYPIGANRGDPGWKELDYLVLTTADLYYAFEVDTAFTHRMKQNADVLHDAIILEALAELNLYPKVFHLDGDQELSTQKLAEQAARSYLA